MPPVVLLHRAQEYLEPPTSGVRVGSLGFYQASRTNERTRFRVASGRTLSDPVIPFNGRVFFCDGAQRIHGLDLLPDQWVGRSRVNDEWA